MRSARRVSLALLTAAGLWLGYAVLALGPAITPATLSAVDVAYTQNFDGLASTGSSSVVPTGWGFDESGTAAAVNGLYTAGTGSGNAGDIYSFGSAANPSDRALGQLRSGTLVPVIGGAFTNNT